MVARCGPPEVLDTDIVAVLLGGDERKYLTRAELDDLFRTWPDRGFTGFELSQQMGDLIEVTMTPLGNGERPDTSIPG